MLNDFLTYIQDQQLWQPNDKVLLAVSGGIDSMVLVQLCLSAKVSFGIAHCNFALRGSESDGDQELVEQLAATKSIPFHLAQFDTKAISEKQQKSIQIVARTLRYDWFEQLRQEHDYTVVATAHHLNDSVETVLMNLTNGCGIRGLHGILPQNKAVVRPLLFATKTQIENYAQLLQIAYRTDSSNQNTKYTRNFVRQKVVPLLQQINPNLEQTMQHNITRFRELEALYDQAIAAQKQQVISRKGTAIFIHIEQVATSLLAQSLLYEILAPLGFNTAQVATILQQQQQEKGATYWSNSYQLTKDRTHWIVQPKIENEPINIAIPIPELPHQTTLPQQQLLTWQLLQQKIDFSQQQVAKNCIYIDADKLSFPLLIRSPRPDDIFSPLGMQGKQKKLGKYLRDAKVNALQKETILLLCDADERIIWVIGQRASEPYKITDQTTTILRIEMLSSNSIAPPK